MVKESFIPKQGDIVYVDLNPTKGQEQAGYRPAVVISTNVFNKYTNMMMVLPITNNNKSFPTHYILEDTKKVKGAVLCEHIRSIDYFKRKNTFVEKLSNNDLLNILTLINVCIED